MTAHHWPPGRPAWVGADCLVPRIEDGSHITTRVATYDHATSTSLCPECGAVVAWSAEPSQWADPRCRECQGREWQDELDRTEARLTALGNLSPARETDALAESGARLRRPSPEGRGDAR